LICLPVRVGAIIRKPWTARRKRPEHERFTWRKWRL
jgi:hypothetical protein